MRIHTKKRTITLSAVDTAKWEGRKGASEQDAFRRLVREFAQAAADRAGKSFEIYASAADGGWLIEMVSPSNGSHAGSRAPCRTSKGKFASCKTNRTGNRAGAAPAPLHLNVPLSGDAEDIYRSRHRAGAADTRGTRIFIEDGWWGFVAGPREDAIRVTNDEWDTFEHGGIPARIERFLHKHGWPEPFVR